MYGNLKIFVEKILDLRNVINVAVLLIFGHVIIVPYKSEFDKGILQKKLNIFFGHAF